MWMMILPLSMILELESSRAYKRCAVYPTLNDLQFENLSTLLQSLDSVPYDKVFLASYKTAW